MKKLWLLVALCLTASVANAQEQPAKKRSRWASVGRMLTCRHEVVDRKFCVAAGLIGAAMVADGVSTVSVLKRCRNCESNPFLGRNPRPVRVFGLGTLLFTAEVSVMYVAKKYGGEAAWLTVPAIAVPLHSAAAWANSTERGDPVCPANGAGCNTP
jgi:hypothetical protein